MSTLHQPAHFLPLDDYASSTSAAQVPVERELASLGAAYRASSSSAPGAAPELQRAAHLAFLARALHPLPASHVAFDSTRPWLVYWAAHASYLLAAPLHARLQARAAETLLKCQATLGGFGGAHGQTGHLMATYAAVMAFAYVGDRHSWEAIDRPAMYAFLLSLKLPDGSFTVHVGGEVDVRATYCVVCVSLLLGIATPHLLEGCDEFIASCQTYEGGLCAASQPSYSAHATLDRSAPRPALGEAHGGYTFCAVASHLALSLLPLPPCSSSAPQLDEAALLRWATWQQGAASELGGFRGRTNKLVDGCYGWFAGAGMFACLQALLQRRAAWWKSEEEEEEKAQSAAEDEEWIDDPLSFSPSDAFLFDRLALQEYVLLAAQDASGGGGGGGLRDKPGARCDAYHTCYNLSGMSLAQHRLRVDAASRRALEDMWKSQQQQQQGDEEAEEEEADAWRKACYVSCLAWSAEAAHKAVVGEAERNELVPTHPVFNVAFPKLKEMLDWAYGQA